MRLVPAGQDGDGNGDDNLTALEHEVGDVCLPVSDYGEGMTRG
jgi:hypothetical protein